MKTLATCLLLLISLLSSAASAQTGVLDQVSPSRSTWFWVHEPANVWQQQVRAGVEGRLEAFEVWIQGPIGAQLELRLRAGDGWSVNPVIWSATYTKLVAPAVPVVFDVLDAALDLDAGDTFVIEAQGNDTDADLIGNYMHPDSGSPFYPEELYLNGPGCYDDCGWRMGFRTWMREDVGFNYCVLSPNSTGAPAVMSASGSGSTAANDLVLHAGPAPAGQLGIFLYGPTVKSVPLANGFLCVGPGTTGIARLPAAVVDGAGTLTHALDLSLPPSPQTAIVSGSKWYFQAYFRDPAGGGAGVNLSDGLEVVFRP